MKILFLCTGNSCRSQMAEGWTRYLHPEIFTVYSAGVEIHGMNPHAVQVMGEAGIDISGQRSQHLDDFSALEIDYVITVCSNAQESCPIFPRATKTLHVGFDDPPAMARELAAAGAGAEVQLDCYRRVRDQIGEFVRTLPERLSA
ncbi:arsenate reductase ArsC [Desulfotalea psychrophila]|nr:arsenate reductase ArsC [Desulfotalea psychrophila]